MPVRRSHVPRAFAPAVMARSWRRKVELEYMGMTRSACASVIALTFWTAYVACAAPSDSAKWSTCVRRMKAAEAHGDFHAAKCNASDLYSHCRTKWGDAHPDTRLAAAAVRAYGELQNADDQTKRGYVAVAVPAHRAWLKIDDMADDVLPSDDVVLDLVAAFQMWSKHVPEDISKEVPVRANCVAGIARVLAISRASGAAIPFMLAACKSLSSCQGYEIHMRSMELGLAMLLRELGIEPAKQVELLELNIDFADQHQVTPNLAWWKERAMMQLAETYYRQGNHQEADRLYAEVRSQLPEDSDHDLVGWCKSWCDRHEARQLMEKGDWDAAYEKILQARVGTIDYGHRNLSKGLTMERILRMSAEIQRKRGNNKEADEDQEYADLIARHAAKLRTAVEAELRRLNQPEANTTPQPLPAPSS